MFDKFWKQFLIEAEETFAPLDNSDPAATVAIEPEDEQPEEPEQITRQPLGFDAWLENNGFYNDGFVGEGAHGAVYRVIRKKGGMNAVAKRVPYKDYYNRRLRKRIITNPDKEVENYKSLSRMNSPLFPKVYFADIEDVPKFGQPIDGETERAAVIIMEELVPLPPDLLRKLFTGSKGRKGEEMQRRDAKLFKNKTILKNFVEQILKNSRAISDTNISKISDHVVRNYRTSPPSTPSFKVSEEGIRAKTFSNIGKIIFALILDGVLKFQEGKNLPLEEIYRLLRWYKDDLLFKPFNKNYSRPLIATDTNALPTSPFSGFEIFDSEGVIPEIFPEADNLKVVVDNLEKEGIIFKDVHSDNVMMRPGTNEIVITDVGGFTTPTQRITENMKKQVASCIVFDNKDRILIIKRSKTDDWKPGWWDIPGGHMEKGEIPVEGAIRETDEESGLTVRNLVQVETKQFPDIIKHFFATRDYDGEVYFRPNEKTGIVEHDEYKWVTIEQLEDIQNSVVPLSTVKKAMHLV